MRVIRGIRVNTDYEEAEGKPSPLIPVRSQRRHKLDSPTLETASRIVVPSDGRGRLPAGVRLDFRYSFRRDGARAMVVAGLLVGVGDSSSTNGRRG